MDDTKDDGSFVRCWGQHHQLSHQKDIQGQRAAARSSYSKILNNCFRRQAIHGHTAAEVIMERADAEKPHMGLMTWADASEGKIKLSDVVIAKTLDYSGYKL